MNQAHSALQATFGRAVAAYQAGRLQEAEQQCRLVVAAMPKLFDARFLMGLVQAGQGAHRPAIESFDRALAIRPGIPDVLAAKAGSQHALGRLADALKTYETALTAAPASAELAYNRATVLEALGRHDDAMAGYGDALAKRADFVEALNNRGVLLQALGQTDAALADYDRALLARPAHVPVLHNRARLLRDLGRTDEALRTIERALAAAPGRPDLLNSRGLILLAGGRVDEALASFERGLATAPSDGALLSNKAKALLRLGRAAEALAAIETAPAARRAEPDFAALEGSALYELQRYEDAVAACDRGLGGRRDHAGLLTDRANALRECGRFDEALADYDRALAIEPGRPAAVYGRATLMLFRGRHAEGWPGFEERRITPVWRPREAGTPEWEGGPLAGRRLLLHAEQGLGDTIQFVRFAALLAERGEDVVVEVPESLHGLVAGMGDLKVVARQEVPPPHDVHASLMSLPHLLGLGEDLLAGRVPYFAADPARVASWRARLPNGPFRIGIAWQGNPNAAVDRLRSVPLAAFAPLAALPGVELVSLQKGAGTEQLSSLPEGMKVTILPEDFASGPDSFMDTAAVLANLDLVVSIDSAVAHLAGALGRPLIVALKQVPEWRWGPSAEASPWYPSARLMRQAKRGDWDELFGRIAAAVAALKDGR
ncbi:tetratricopeptide repeat protein [Kaistia geumhonensis]|uniref:Tetratricopeptide (TPR) repeat protein n=1 Tax=Kaistia geumhonensis TaxID=410839 RepID=A0ABU0M390_9HYPH|nr:tetratricopeptide repeat protein [Kaistia geumhonensis]MCX5479340.1 tetratricopeptide repeat protein [Kaistia geumhonensis]MDQ0515437.1 tetratricopeptide (TPR) repeat protein [Kaistia geumhonensis]